MNYAICNSNNRPHRAKRRKLTSTRAYSSKMDRKSSGVEPDRRSGNNGHSTVYNKVKSRTKINHKANLNPHLQARCWWWLFRWPIFLFIIQLVQPIEALEHSARNLIRFTHSTYSTYFEDELHTTPLYTTSHTTNSLSSQSTSRNSVKEQGTSTTTSTALAKQIGNKSKILTTNKQIQSIKFDKQYPWFTRPKYNRISSLYKNTIDFAHHHTTISHLNTTSKLHSNFKSTKKTRTNPSYELIFDELSKHSVHSVNRDNFNNRKTTIAFIPFSSTIHDKFDYSSTDYDRLVDKFQKNFTYPTTTTTITTKLPRIRKNVEHLTTPVHSIGLANRTYDVNKLKNLDSLHINQRNDSKQLGNSSQPTNKFDTSNQNDTNRSDNSTQLQETIDSPFLIWLGHYIPHPSFEKLIVTFAQVICLIFTIIGNVFVIISIFTYNPLRNVQNMFLVSLAVSDITVAVCILPLNIGYYLIEKWVFGIHLCKFWLTSDILCCTASILNLCAIAVDRYQAIHDPINYRMKRTTKRVLLTIFFVWALSAVTSIPPLLGWNDWPDEFTPEVPCRLTSERSYVVFSSSVSFYIPLVIMTTVYIKIYKSAKKRLRKRAQSTGRASVKKGTKKMIQDAKHFPQQKQYLVDGKLVEVNDGQAAVLQNYLDKGIINADNQNKIYVQLTQGNQPSGHLLIEDRTDVSFQQHGQQSSSTGHMPSNMKSDSGTGSSTAAVIRVTNLLGAIKGSKISESRQRQFSVTEPNTSSSNDEVIFDYTTVNDGQHSLCLTGGKQVNAIEFDPASLPITSAFKDNKTFNRNKIKRQSTPEEASDSSESLVDKENEFSNNNGSQSEQPTITTTTCPQQQQSVSQQSIAKSFKNRFQHSIFHHQSQASSSTPPTTLSVHYSSSQTSFSNTSGALNQAQPVQHTKFSSFNLLRRYKSRFHRANNATCFSNFEPSSHSRPSIGVVSATSTPEVTSPSGNHSPKDQLPEVKEEPLMKSINRNYLSATFKSTTCSALSKIASDKSKKLTGSLHTLNINVTPSIIHRAKSEDVTNFGLLHAVSQRLLEEQQNMEDEVNEELEIKPRRKSMSQARLSIGSIGQTERSVQESTSSSKMRTSSSCLNVFQGRSNVHRDSSTSNSNQKSSETTQKTISGQSGVLFTSSSGPSDAIQPEKNSQNSNVSSHSNNSNAISECNQRCLSPTTLLQLPNRRHHYISSEQKQTLINIACSETNRQGTSSNSQRNHSTNSYNYSSTYSTTSTSVMTTSQFQLGAGSGTTESAIGSGSSYNQSIRHPSNAYSNVSHSMVKQVWDQKQRISLSKERKAAQVLGIVMGAFVVSWLPFFLVYTGSPFCSSLIGRSCELSEFTQMIITWLGYINSSINPIIYTVFNMDFRVAFERILMKCCCAGKFRKQQKLYQQQQQIKLNRRTEHKKKKLLHQQQKQKLREQKNIDGEKDSFNDTSRKSSFKDERKSSLKQLMNNSSSINKIDEMKILQLEEEHQTTDEKNLKMLARSLTGLDKVPETSDEYRKDHHSGTMTNKPTISYSCDNLKIEMKDDCERILEPLTNKFSSPFMFRTNSSLKKRKSEIMSITTSYEQTLTDALLHKLNLNKFGHLTRMDDNNNDSNLTEIIMQTNLKQLENQCPDYCHFKI